MRGLLVLVAPLIAQPDLAEFCRRNHVRKLANFGSALTERFKDSSDIDILVEFDDVPDLSLGAAEVEIPFVDARGLHDGSEPIEHRADLLVLQSAGDARDGHAHRARAEPERTRHRHG